MNLAKLKLTKSVFSNHHRFDEIVRCLVSGILLTAASLKAAQLYGDAALNETLMNMRAGLHVAFEVALAMFIIAPFWRVVSWSISLLCFTVFGIVALTKAFNGGASCGCFGNVAASPSFTFGLDVVVVALLLSCPHAPSIPTKRVLRSTVWIRFAVCITVVLLGWFLAAMDRPVSIANGIRSFDSDEWVGRRLPFIDDVVIDEAIMLGQWTILFYDPGCGKCQRAIEDLEACSGNIALISVEPHASLRSALTQTSWSVGEFRTDSSWFITTPTLVHLTDGVIDG
jgi:hypothetical protein